MRLCHARGPWSARDQGPADRGSRPGDAAAFMRVRVMRHLGRPPSIRYHGRASLCRSGYTRPDDCHADLARHRRRSSPPPRTRSSASCADRDDPTRGLYEQVRYHLGLDGPDAPAGKRMRPLLGLLAYASITGEFEPALPGAAAVELGHNFSLVHDDIEDGDTERRHRPTLWSLHGIPQAINTGDTLFTLSRIALHRLTDLGFSDSKVLRLMRLYDLTCLALCEGQYIDIWTSEHDTPMSVELYFDMIGRKTAALIAASIEAGALLATDDEEVIARYRGFGWALGLAFQLNDDLLGIWGAEQATGKEPSDLARHKKTLPVLYALEHGASRGRERASRRYYASPDPSRAEVAEAVGDPRADRRPRLHPRPGPTLPRRGDRGARRGRRRAARGARGARTRSSSGSSARRPDRRGRGPSREGAGVTRRIEVAMKTASIDLRDHGREPRCGRRAARRTGPGQVRRRGRGVHRARPPSRPREPLVPRHLRGRRAGRLRHVELGRDAWSGHLRPVVPVAAAHRRTLPGPRRTDEPPWPDRGPRPRRRCDRAAHELPAGRGRPWPFYEKFGFRAHGRDRRHEILIALDL